MSQLSEHQALTFQALAKQAENLNIAMREAVEAWAFDRTATPLPPSPQRRLLG